MTAFTDSYFTIDHGNTNTTIQLHENGVSSNIKLEEYLSSEQYQTYPGLVTSVGAEEISFPASIKDIKEYHHESFFLDMSVNYSQSLGSDRLINAYWIYKNELCPAESILHIDAGTFTTMDMISLNGFEGGFIFPGETTYLQSFSRGEKLPTFNKANIKNEMTLPRDTEAAIKQSYLLFMVGALKEVIMKYNPQSIIVTGGNAVNLVFLLSQLGNESNEKLVKYKTIPKLTHKALKFFYMKLRKENLQ
jgi:type III pantothenate kinase